MTSLAIPSNEEARIEALKKFDILDTPRDSILDHITKLTAHIFKTPISIISFVDKNRIWFKSHQGLSENQLDRDPGLCASAILSNDIYIVEDAKNDPRTMQNPLVSGEFGLRFYAAVPLQTEDKFNLGALSIIDKTPRHFSENDQEALKLLGKIVMNNLEMRMALRNAVDSLAG